MKQSDIISFFDRHAAEWDEELIRDDFIIDTILNNAGICEGCRVLDVACGTGVLIPDYLERGASEVVGVDISPEMIHIAGRKIDDKRVRFLCGDIESVELRRDYDCIVIYNAFPHFPEPERLIKNLSGKLKPGGSLTVAHGMSREEIDRRHKGCAEAVSVGLMEATDLANIFSRYLSVSCKISDERMYQVTGIKA